MVDALTAVMVGDEEAAHPTVHSTRLSAVEQSLPSRAAEDRIRGRSRIRVPRSGSVAASKDRCAGCRSRAIGARGLVRAGADGVRVRGGSALASSRSIVSRNRHTSSGTTTLERIMCSPGTGSNALVSRPVRARRVAKAGLRPSGESRITRCGRAPLRRWWSWRTTDAGEPAAFQ